MRLSLGGAKPKPQRERPDPAKDFRDQAVQEALDRAVGVYRPEKRLRARLARIAAIAALTLAISLGFWAILHHSTPKPRPKAPERKPIPIQLVPAPAPR